MVDYPGAIDRIITSPSWVFPDALRDIPTNDLTIVLHKTACNAPCTALSTASFFANDLTGHKSVHFIIDLDGTVVQVVQLKDGAGGNCCLEAGFDQYWKPLLAKYGNLNRCTISIEHIDQTVDNTQVMPQVQIQASFALVKWLAQRYKLDASHIKGHNTLDPLSRARCPGTTYPMSDLIKALNMSTQNPHIKQAAYDTWHSVAINGATLRYDSGIAIAWQEKYLGGVNMPPPSTDEFHTHDWNGVEIVAQMFGALRCEWNGQATWIPTFSG